jgi:hypothetical protein
MVTIGIDTNHLKQGDAVTVEGVFLAFQDKKHRHESAEDFIQRVQVEADKWGHVVETVVEARPSSAGILVADGAFHWVYGP